MFNRIKRLFSSSNTPSPLPAQPSEGTVTQFSDHKLPQDKISRNALRVIAKLQSSGFAAYLVGGGIRDLLLAGRPKDFDVATNATPEETKRLFRSSMIIGRRFRIVHVRFGREIIEVTTFRAHHGDTQNGKDAKQSQEGMLLRDNVYGDIQSDAIRRDFTVNALYYDPSKEEILDFTSGLEDINNRTLRIIGDAEARYREDPVRMLRAIRFSAKLGFKMCPQTKDPIPSLANLLTSIPPARLFEEALKLMLSGSATATLNLLRDNNLFEPLFPGTEHCLKQGDAQQLQLVTQAVINTDKRLRQNKRVTPAFIYAAFLWLPLQAAMRKLIEENNLSPSDAMQQAAQGVIGQQLASTSIPKRFSIPMREIWTLQLRLPHREGKKAFSLMEHPRFRAAYDFILLREEAGENLNGLGAWWTQFQDANEEQKVKMAKEFKGNPKRRHRRKKPKNANSDTPRPEQ